MVGLKVGPLRAMLCRRLTLRCAGHLKEQNYGADWGDYVSFTKGMKQKARKLGVDLLLVDTGVCCPPRHTCVSCAIHTRVGPYSYRC
jgi:hypothetical protein